MRNEHGPRYICAGVDVDRRQYNFASSRNLRYPKVMGIVQVNIDCLLGLAAAVVFTIGSTVEECCLAHVSLEPTLTVLHSDGISDRADVQIRLVMLERWRWLTG